MQVFNELDTQDEADMMDLATFFQTLSGDETRPHSHACGQTQLLDVTSHVFVYTVQGVAF